MKEVLRNLLLVIIALLFSYYFAIPAQDFYCANIGTCTGGFFGFDLGVLIWMALLYTFCVTILLTLFGGKHRYWWIGIALIPAILFELVIDPLHIYFPVILGLIAWGLGTFVHKVLQKFAPSFLAKIG